MGLAQKRISKEFQDAKFPEWEKKLQTAMGFKVPVDVKWDTMMDDDYAKKEDYFDWYGAVYFSPLLQVMESICGDAMGKEGLKTQLKKIVIDGTDGADPSQSTFEKGVLTIRHKFNSNVGDVKERVKAWTAMIENKL